MSRLPDAARAVLAWSGLVYVDGSERDSAALHAALDELRGAVIEAEIEGRPHAEEAREHAVRELLRVLADYHDELSRRGEGFSPLGELRQAETALRAVWPAVSK